MNYKKDGKSRQEFWPRQDLADDPAGQAQASELARGAMLRIALGKLTKDEKAIRTLMAIWKGEKVTEEGHTPIEFLFNLLPETLSSKEKELVKELQMKILG